MPFIDINLDEVQESNLVPDTGWYNCKIVDAEVKDNKKKDGQYINWSLEVDEPGSEFVGARVWAITSLKPQALFALKNFIKAAEFEYDPDGFDIQELVGLEIQAYIEKVEYEGNWQAKITKYRKV